MSELKASELKTTLNGYVGYRGREGQLSFLLHRITGLGTALFLTIHILDTSTVFFSPSLYADAIALYRNVIFELLEIALVFCVIFHGVNGIRIALFDWFPQFWKIHLERRWVTTAIVLSILLWLPAAAIMMRNILVYNFGLFGGG